MLILAHNYRTDAKSY